MERSHSWPSALAWKASIPRGIAGSNPALSASTTFQRWFFYFHYNLPMSKYRKMLSDYNAEPIQAFMRLIETQSKQTIATWCLNYAEAHILPIYNKQFPLDSRPQSALDAAQAWLSKEIKLPEAKTWILACHSAARETETYPAAQAAARALGQAASTIHAPTHALGLPLYGSLALAYDTLGLNDSWENLEVFALQECEKMLLSFRAKAVQNEPNPVKVRWFC